MTGPFYETPEFATACKEAEARLSAYERAVSYLRAAANWSDEDMANPIIAMAARDCARNGLTALNEPLIPDTTNDPR